MLKYSARTSFSRRFPLGSSRQKCQPLEERNQQALGLHEYGLRSSDLRIDEGDS